MRRHGWQPPYHPLQVVAIAVFVALGFAFYVFFAPFSGKKKFEYLTMGLYTPLVANVFFLYVWCAAADPVDVGVLKSNKYHNIVCDEKQPHLKESKVGESISSLSEATAVDEDNSLEKYPRIDAVEGKSSTEFDKESAPCCNMAMNLILWSCHPLLLIWDRICSPKQSSEKQSSEVGMFYCRLCEAEVNKHSKHCRVCDKCVDGFDHHCRWLNTCIGRKNYRCFFILMLSALLLLVLQWSIGVIVLVCCFLDRKQFNVEISSKLGSSFSFVPFVIVIAFCMSMAVVATLPLAQLFFFHVLLMQKGISTYDYIMALREQEQEVAGGRQSSHMSLVSSRTGISNASSSNTFNRGAWCTPPRMLLNDEFDVIPPENGMSRMTVEDQNENKHSGTTRISPWTLARMNVEEVSKAVAQARRKSKVLQPVAGRKATWEQETSSTFKSGSDQVASRFESRRRASKRARLPADIPVTRSSTKATGINGTEWEPTRLTDLTDNVSWRMPSARICASSPESSMESTDLHPFYVSSFGADDSQGLATIISASSADDKSHPLSRSTSDGYEASCGEDSDSIPSRITHMSSNWSNLVLNYAHDNASDVSSMTYSANGRHFEDSC